MWGVGWGGVGWGVGEEGALLPLQKGPAPPQRPLPPPISPLLHNVVFRSTVGPKRSVTVEAKRAYGKQSAHSELTLCMFSLLDARSVQMQNDPARWIPPVLKGSKVDTRGALIILGWADPR